MSWSNYQDVLSQLQAAGLQVSSLEVGRLKRCRTVDDKEQRGWYIVHELVLDSGDAVLVGSFGAWRGQENNAQKIQLGKATELTDDQKAALRIRLREDQRRAEAARKAGIDRAARRADQVWYRLAVTGRSEYLERKGVQPFGVKFSPSGAVVVPMCNDVGRVYGLQFILSRESHRDRIRKTGRDKEFWPAGLEKKGKFHLIGGTPTWVVLLCEGYATGASLHMATGLPVAIAFDCGNLLPVAESIHNRYRDARILICADDDFLTDGNPGIAKASAAALAVNGAWIAPTFSLERERKLTDFNDLHCLEGIATVRSQVEGKLVELKWSSRAGPSARQLDGAEGGAAALAVPRDVNDLLEHFVKIYGSEMVWDERNRMIIKLSALRTDVMNKESVREWQASPARRYVSAEKIGFDPTGSDPDVECNLWAGFSTAPVSGCCDRLLELLRYLCGNEENADELYQWILKWLAYPLQHPGAKLQTALLMHGEEGSGKNLFFGAIRAIYGRYGGNINQDDLEDKFNDWASAKLFIIANEVVTRVELYHVQGKLKNMITEREWQINPKNMPRRQEQNHCNFVFFSNRVDIAKLDKKDRRYCVVWTPGPLGAEFYEEVADEMRHGGTAALHDYLLNLDLGDFSPHTKPPDTRAKRDLIDLGLDNTDRFYQQWTGGDLDLPVVPCVSEDLYAAYKRWASINGIQKHAPSHIFLASIGKRDDVRKRREEIWADTTKRWRTMIHPSGHWDCPADKRKLDWLTDCARAFADAAREMKTL